MNFLAHIYLSHNNTDLEIGNFIADHVKGKKFESFPNAIANGIIMHRKIDTFTDAHPVFRNSKRYFQPEFGLYSGVIVDVVYDHFLAKNWEQFHDLDLYRFTQQFYKTLQKNEALLPDKTKHILPIMVNENWLYSYKTIKGITNILTQMDARTQFKSKMSTASNTLTQYYAPLEYDFFDFIVQLDSYSRTLINQINNHEDQFFRSP
ncbi:ACP phosphodiesterase [Flavobacterium agricola]|uniref:ACP phosphodiesterase n=1 Tax=Flavobacterium agricola TaxID=2870839 RepID=A0ABY6LZ73_9FLAO|nr:ACP phosphodiesterase [Flavobacterium agricola]UYW01624.1 ACP phosphodiesterase [Flavobacterium agricola]